MNRDTVVTLMAKVGAAPKDKTPRSYEGYVNLFECFAYAVIESERQRKLSWLTRWMPWRKINPHR